MVKYSTLSTRQMGELPFVGPAIPIAQKKYEVKAVNQAAFRNRNLTRPAGQQVAHKSFLPGQPREMEPKWRLYRTISTISKSGLVNGLYLVLQQYGIHLNNHVIAYKGGQSCEDGTANAYLVPEFVDRHWNNGRPFVILNSGESAHF
ncbi:hypothetical protein BV898_10672 [Hypsibius exemplaris]|uniref:Uncharacterized protein n=1 Tax=Hypsibius exemplaris TaxID=2072580 RepID=A0A1W0WIW2_HYPEX|nr:hypothetical protein BV898_10672 [Hypsibius exemplaris]